MFKDYRWSDVILWYVLLLVSGIIGNVRDIFDLDYVVVVNNVYN